MAYESPIKITYREGIPEFRTFHEKIADEIGEHVDCRIMASVQEQMAIEIDKPELLKALRYDRNQYEVGFAYGYRQGVRDTEEKQKAEMRAGSPLLQEADAQEEWIETDHKGTPYLCPKCQCFSNLRYYWCPWCGKDMRPEAIRNADNTENEEDTTDEI